MSQTTARTFIAAAVLLVVSLAINIYGRRIFESQMTTAEELPLYTMYDSCSGQPDPWERAAGLIGLLAISVSIAGAMFWDREPQPMTAQASILMLDASAERRKLRVAAPLKSAAVAKVHADEGHTRLQEDESLTPLERVIRGY